MCPRRVIYKFLKLYYPESLSVPGFVPGALKSSSFFENGYLNDQIQRLIWTIVIWTIDIWTIGIRTIDPFQSGQL